MLSNVNLSLTTGTVPTSFKTTVVTSFPAPKFQYNWDGLHRYQFYQVIVTHDNRMIPQYNSKKKSLCYVWSYPTEIAFSHLRNIDKVRSSLSMDYSGILSHSSCFIQTLITGLPHTKSLQMVPNTAARLKFDHRAPIIVSLHWPPFHAKLDLKVLLMTYKIVNGLHICLISSPRALCSQNTGLPSVPRVRKKSARCRAFSCHALFLWNHLPVDLR